MFKRLLNSLAIFPIQVYQVVIRPIFPPSCRHIPSCSEYSKQAIQIHGVVKGVQLGAKRICSCHPRGSHGYDPVPKKESQHVT